MTFWYLGAASIVLLTGDPPPERYEGLMHTITCPSDIDVYGEYYDYGYHEGEDYCGAESGEGYWEYRYPNWHIFKRKKRFSHEEARTLATVNGKFSGLSKTLWRPEDEQEYGRIAESGFWPETTYAGERTPAGHWVYVAPYWFIWNEKQLDGTGWAVLRASVASITGERVVELEHRVEHHDWARKSLALVAAAIPELERRTGLPFPGRDPFPILEVQSLKSAGRGGSGGLLVASPPRGTTWTLLHELIHVWNAEVRPAWVCEGQSNLISYLLMKEFRFPFDRADANYVTWITEWQDSRATGLDYPLFPDGRDQYDRVPQGKAMAFWALVYELLGEHFIYEVFRAYISEGAEDNALFVRMLAEHGFDRPARLMSGWIERGPYMVTDPADAEPRPHPFPEKLPVLAPIISERMTKELH